MAKKKKHGFGASCSVLLKNLHPRKLVAEKFPNRTDQDRLDNLLAQKKEKKWLIGEKSSAS